MSGKIFEENVAIPNGMHLIYIVGIPLDAQQAGKFDLWSECIDFGKPTNVKKSNQIYSSNVCILIFILKGIASGWAVNGQQILTISCHSLQQRTNTMYSYSIEQLDEDRNIAEIKHQISFDCFPDHMTFAAWHKIMNNIKSLKGSDFRSCVLFTPDLPSKFCQLNLHHFGMIY